MWVQCCIPRDVDKAHTDLATRTPSPKVSKFRYLTTHNTQKRHTSVSLTDWIRNCSPRKRALDRGATGMSRVVMYTTDYLVRIPADYLVYRQGFCGVYTICPGKHWDLTLKRVTIGPQKSVYMYIPFIFPYNLELEVCIERTCHITGEPCSIPQPSQLIAYK